MTSCNHSLLHPNIRKAPAVKVICLNNWHPVAHVHIIIYTHNILFPLRYLGRGKGGRGRGINRKGELYFVISFLQNDQLLVFFS